MGKATLYEFMIRSLFMNMNKIDQNEVSARSLVIKIPKECQVQVPAVKHEAAFCWSEFIYLHEVGSEQVLDVEEMEWFDELLKQVRSFRGDNLVTDALEFLNGLSRKCRRLGNGLNVKWSVININFKGRGRGRHPDILSVMKQSLLDALGPELHIVSEYSVWVDSEFEFGFVNICFILLFEVIMVASARIRYKVQSFTLCGETALPSQSSIVFTRFFVFDCIPFLNFR